MNVERKFAGRSETPLTDVGRVQAREAGKRMKLILPKIDVIISSPSSRAHDTAKHIASELDYPHDEIELSELFYERNFGVLEGSYSPDFFAVRTYQDIDAVDGVETVEALHERARRALDYIHSRPEAAIVIVGHGSHGRALRRIVNNVPYHDDEAIQQIGNAEIIELL